MIPLGTPIMTASGVRVDHISIAKGASVKVPIRAINRSETLWGLDAKEFVPERWLDNEAGLTTKAKEVQGYHHLLSFSDGPRTCLGRAFALAEFKVRHHAKCCINTNWWHPLVRVISSNRQLRVRNA